MKPNNPRFMKNTAFLIFTALTFLPAQATDDVWVVSKTGVSDQKTTVAVLDFFGDLNVSEDIKRHLNARQLDTITASAQSNINALDSEDILKNLATLQRQNINFVVTGKIHKPSKDQYAISYELIDIDQGFIKFSQTQIINPNTDKTTLTQRISEQIYQEIFGVSGDILGKIAYVEESYTQGKKTSALKLMDASAKPIKTLFEIQGSIMTPAFSPDAKQIAFVAQAKNSLPVIYIQRIDSQVSKPALVTPFWGHNLAPSFSSDGKKLLFSASHENNNPNIYQLNLSTQHLTRLTELSGAENSPKYLPDGDGFLFTADHNSRVQTLYHHRFYDAKNSPLATNVNSLSLSQDGSKIAYAQGLQIVISDRKGKITHKIPVVAEDISLSFSPSSARLLYSYSHQGKSKLKLYTLATNKTQTLNTSGLIKDVVWSN